MKDQIERIDGLIDCLACGIGHKADLTLSVYGKSVCLSLRDEDIASLLAECKRYVNEQHIS